MRVFWALFFIFWPIVAVAVCWVAPSPEFNWWFPGAPDGPIGRRIEDLFDLILIITTVVFIGTQVGLGYVLLKGALKDPSTKAWHSHGSHSLEVIWTIVPSGILLFIALYQMDTWADFRIQSHAPDQVQLQPLAVLTARQFEWRVRYAAPGRLFKNKQELDEWVRSPEPGDLYGVNELHVPVAKPACVYLRSGDVQHSFFLPTLRIKQDAVPGLAIPVWFTVLEEGEKPFLCAELCGWGHYKMKARLIAEADEEFQDFLKELQVKQSYDGVTDLSSQSVVKTSE